MYTALIILLVAQAVSSKPPSSMYGAYQDCMMACRTIQVRRDHTFVLRFSGDLYNDQRQVGRWTWLGSNRIHAVIAPNTSAPTVAEESVATDDDFEVTVVDPQGAIFAGATITPVYPEPGASVSTSDQGVAVIPRCPEFEVRVLGYVGRYRPTNSASTRFEVTLTIAQTTAFAIDEVWEITDGELFVLDDQGAFDPASGLHKISKSKERAIFGKPASN